MSADIEKAIEHLRAFVPLREESAEEFLAEVNRFVDQFGSAAIEPLLMLADDNCELEGVMGAMLSAIEGLPRTQVITGLLRVLPAFWVKSPMWCLTELKKCLWDPLGEAELIRQLGSAPTQTRTVLRDLMREVAKRTPALADQAERILSAF